MENRSLEIKRKSLHLLLGIILVILISLGLLSALILFFIILLSFILFYLSKQRRIPIICWFLDNFERPEHKAVFPGKGPLFYLIGAELALVMFTKDIAIASILILAIGDSIPHIIGLHYGRIRNPFCDKKFIEGTIIGLLLCVFAASWVVSWHEALLASIVAIFLEGIDMKIGMEKIDDNLVLPVAAGLSIHLLRIFL